MINRSIAFLLGLQTVFSVSCSQAQSAENIGGVQEQQVLAFPGAEGFGKYTSGGRGGKVLLVTNLNDSGEGSLRTAIMQEGPRIIVFKVGGTIALESPLEIRQGDLTIAGQSAPGEGITIKNYPIKIHADNIIIRYIRSRMGDERSVEDDAISSIGNKDLIIDHCTFSWGTDESASFYDNENFTLQWSIISESLNNSVHKKGEHGYGGIWGGKGASFHHNLLVHHKSRNPRFNGARTKSKGKPEQEVVDFRNNVVYNWRANSTYGGEQGNHNMVNNYYKAGPATEANRKKRILDTWTPNGYFYVTGNYVAGFPEISKNNRLGVEGKSPDASVISSAVPVVGIPDESAEAAYHRVLAEAGASHRRDVLDSRIVKEVATGTASYGKQKDGIIDSQQDVGGWPALEEGQAAADQDRDGMPDAWEQKHQLDPANAADASAITLDQHYTNIEVYLNGLADQEGT
ncbi:polysaccharide lyase family 1 protein [Cesiribacter sp. SM1]|uniref:pectate lyase family protein n=1 Tax=Cesiribacter sp. SM1 TaxID=2861196 RepID=UPI001CD468CF|nr:pectate lyase [Cesiribacter sp. SM1]